jgi:hypothetical protein
MKRKWIRKRVLEILRAANIPDVGDDIFSNKSLPSIASEPGLLPCINLFTKISNVERSDEAPKSYRKTMEITLEIIAINDDDDKLSDQLDDISQRVEDVIEDDFELERQLEAIDLTSIQTTTEGDGQSPIGSTRVIYEAIFIEQARKEMVMDDLLALGNNWKMNNNENEDAKDEIQFQEPE